MRLVYSTRCAWQSDKLYTVLAVPLQSDERYIASERNLVGQLFFHQIRANAMSWGNCSFTKFGQSHCRGATVLSPNSGERNVVGQPFLH
ncbi:uncharacterized protein [Atheta coriaria]|uniref:uncharacterized protein isoform X34 n=1 Tax=Dalotia coriaria TaxID=877792 RepID=UPI0031F37984